MQKINDLSLIYDEENQTINDRYTMDVDLSSIDLSKIPQGVISDIFTSNVNLNNTHATLYINNYPAAFTNCDLRTVKLYFNDLEDYNVVLFNNCKFDRSQIEMLNSLCENFEATVLYYDLKTLSNNKGLLVKSYILAQDIYHYFLKNNDNKPLNEKIAEIEHIIFNIKPCSYQKLYLTIKDQLDDIQKLLFFKYRRLANQTITNLTIDKDMIELFSYLTIAHCRLRDSVLLESSTRLRLFFNLFEIDNLAMPNISISDWQEISNNRFASTPITYRKSLYLELGRQCNGKCSFCRNQYMNECFYNYKNIQKNLEYCINKIDNVIIGGGEPTLNPKDIKKLYEHFIWETNKLYIFSNGTNSMVKFNDESSRGYNWYISRHSYNEDDNARIFGINKNDFASWNYLSNVDNLTLSCTCITSGIDTKDKILKYIQQALSYDITNIIFSNLHNDASMYENVDDEYSKLIINDNIFLEAINYLESKGFSSSYPIISSSGFELTVLKYAGITITFKKYISLEKLNELWLKAVKRSFDLTMNPAGTIYENWSANSKKLEYIKSQN